MSNIINKNNLLNSIGIEIKKPTRRVKYTEEQKLEKRKEYMKRYYEKKKKRLTENGNIKKVRKYVKKDSVKFKMRKGKFIVKFK